MSYKVMSIEIIKSDRRSAGHAIQHGILQKPLKELITLEDAGTLQQKITLDVAEGQEEVPLLYQPVYTTQVNANFPQHVDTNFITSAGVVFLEKLEGGEVQFGAMAPGVPGVVPIKTWAAGFEYTEDMVVYNQDWNFESLNRAFGEAYNALLNHLHLGPIISFSYAAANQTGATNVHTDFIMEVRETLKTALNKCTLARRPASVILASIADRFTIEDALNLNQNPDTAATLTRIGSTIDTIIYYDGWNIDVGSKSYVYPGVTPGKCYLVYPKRYLIELEKHGLMIDTDNADISRLIEQQVVGRTRRGIYADIERSVEEVTLPTS